MQNIIPMNSYFRKNNPLFINEIQKKIKKNCGVTFFSYICTRNCGSNRIQVILIYIYHFCARSRL